MSAKQAKAARTEAKRTETKRATVYLDTEIHRTLRIRAAEMDTTISALVNEAVKESLAEDAEDLMTLEVREGEPHLPFEALVRDLKRRGKL